MRKLLIAIIVGTLASGTAAATKKKCRTVDRAFEASGIKVEWFESSGRGFITPYNCHRCKKKIYEFSEKPGVKRDGEYISFETFLEDYWNARHPTIFIEPITEKVLGVKY